MTGRDLEALFAHAVGRVEQSHLDRIVALGVQPAAIAHVNLAHPAFGVLTGVVEAGLFRPGDGLTHIVQPVIEGGGLVDLVAWRSAAPTRWALATGLGSLLNADMAFASRWDGDRLSLLSTPLEWLRHGGDGAVVLDWDAPDLDWLRLFSTIDCASDILAATLRRALSKPKRLPTIRTMEARHAA